MRSDLAKIADINDDGLFSTRSRKRQILTTEAEEKEVPQLSDIEIEEITKKIEEKKHEYESKLEYMNATTELLT